MKVLVVGSKSIHVSSFIGALNSFGIIPDLLSEEKSGFEQINQEMILSFRDVKPWNFVSLESKLKASISALKPEIIHIHQINRVAYFVAKIGQKLGIPVLTTAWGSDVLVVPSANFFYRFLVRKTLQRSEIVTGDSMEMIDAMKKLCPNKEYHLLQYGIDPIPVGEKQNIVYSNRLHKELYRIDQIIQYFAEFVREYQDWQLVIGAIGTETESLKSIVSTLGISEKVKFVGWLEKEDNNFWYSRSKIYISIPRHDGTAVSLLEAMSAGCIPVVSQLDVSKEWVEHGVNGVIESKGQNPLFQALEMDQQQCAAYNQEQIERRALRTTCTKEFINLYKKLLA